MATQEQISAAIERSKEEILADQALGQFAYRSEQKNGVIRTFSDLHDYVDANEYGGLCDADTYPEFWDNEITDTQTSDLNIASASAVQDGVDEWIRNGGLRQ